MSKLLCTVCSANHLAHSRTMAESFLKYNKDYIVFIGLVDKIEDRFDSNEFEPINILQVDQLGISNFDKMSSQYSVVELNCAMKPFLILYLFEKYEPEHIIYLDSDIWVTNSFESVEEKLISFDIIITPHFTNPLPDNEYLPKERDILRSGMFNAGFIAIKNCFNSRAFIKWWEIHMVDECFYNFAEGMGVDQIWLNFLFLMFPNVYIFNNPGANVAYWNLHERCLSLKDNRVFVNDHFPLLFLHISGYRFSEPEILSNHQTRFDLLSMPVLKELMDSYRIKVVNNGYDKYSILPCLYAKKKKKTTGIMRTINKFLKPIGFRVTNI